MGQRVILLSPAPNAPLFRELGDCAFRRTARRRRRRCGEQLEEAKVRRERAHQSRQVAAVAGAAEEHPAVGGRAVGAGRGPRAGAGAARQLATAHAAPQHGGRVVRTVRARNDNNSEKFEYKSKVWVIRLIGIGSSLYTKFVQNGQKSLTQIKSKVDRMWVKPRSQKLSHSRNFWSSFSRYRLQSILFSITSEHINPAITPLKRH